MPLDTTVQLTVLDLVNLSSHLMASSGETLLFDKSMYPEEKVGSGKWEWEKTLMFNLLSKSTDQLMNKASQLVNFSPISYQNKLNTGICAVGVTKYEILSYLSS